MVLIIVASSISLWWCFAKGPFRDPQDALADFYATRDRAEDQLMDPLILNRNRVIPLVLSEVRKKDMPLRRYAISFLGNVRSDEALPILESILADESEVYYFRADALEAIYEISPRRAEILARSLTGEDGMLGDVVDQIVRGDGSKWLSRRTYWQAVLGVHE
ncbi:MAG: hypothetical protein LBE21_04425 [Pseudomonadales bacterium]|nr:hypothetical protein [Pseudomonadales bacterium]